MRNDGVAANDEGEDAVEFTDFDGMILLESLHSAAEGLRRWQEREIPLSRWKYERGANHRHADMCTLDREHVRQEWQIATRLEKTLREAYPDRDFVISHIPLYAVSFFQLVDDAPTIDVPTYKSTDEPIRCQNCRSRRAVRPSPEPDPEFPWLKWGICTVCSEEILLSGGEFFRVIGAAK